MIASFFAELLKLIKRPAVWILGAALTALVVVFGYLLSAVSAGVGASSPPPGIDEATAAAIVRSLLPENVLVNVLLLFSSLGGAVALILGAMVFGSEFGWGTIKSVLTRRGQTRLGFLGGKLLALASVLAVLTVVLLGIGAASSYAIASIEEAPIKWPSVYEFARGAGAGWLVLCAWAALGSALATLFRGSGLAIGIGLVYVLALETVLLSLPGRSELMQNATKVLLGKNSADLANAFGDLPAGLLPANPVEPGTAVAALALYLLVAAGATVLLVTQRDIT